MLSLAQTQLIKATVPLLETGGETLTAHFYQIMLDEYPEVRPLFNQANQASGNQSRALANAVLMYARHIDRLEALGPLVGQIVNKHVSLQILPEHYPIVGACLLRAIREVLGAEIATDAVIDAWAAAYQQLAELLIGAEEQAYSANASATGGWRGARGFRLLRKQVESEEITSFYLAPEDNGPLLDFTPGQYIGMRLLLDGEEVRRNYSLSAAPNQREYRISVKRENGGRVSTYLHDELVEGDRLELFPPAGDFIQMPPFATFRDAASYVATLSHEACHWTAAPHRVNRDLSRYGKDKSERAREELIAELGSCFLCADLGIAPELEPRPDHASYLDSWLRVLADDKRAIFQAAAHAQRAVAYLHGLQPAASEEREAA